MTNYKWPSKKGVHHQNAKLNDAKVRSIRNSYALNPTTHEKKRLAERYGVAKSTIHAIIERINWTHI